MTQDVGRLQRERQMLEQQITELFAFFAKQRAEMVGVPRQTHELERPILFIPGTYQHRAPAATTGEASRKKEIWTRV